MKKLLIPVFLLFTYFALAQTEKRTKVSGTKCSLIPPKGFIASTAFSGFQNGETGASIMINELPAPYQSLVDGFTAEALKTRGMTLLSKQTIDFNGSEATLFNVSQPANGTNYIKLMLIFGDTKVAIFVNGIYPESSKQIEPEIKAALLSTVYDGSQKENPLDAASFTIDIEGTEFQLIRYMSGSLIYSTDGKLPTEKPTLIIANSFAKISPQNQKNYAEERLKKLPGGEQSVVKEMNKVTVDNLDGYEIIAHGKAKDGKAELIYQVMLFNETGDYFIIVGQAKDAFDKYLESYKKITKTFKRK